jgi:hypothetical protein
VARKEIIFVAEGRQESQNNSLEVEQCSIRNDPDDFVTPATWHPPVPADGCSTQAQYFTALAGSFFICYGADQFIS